MYYSRWGPRHWLAAGVVAASMLAGAPAQAAIPLPPDSPGIPFLLTTSFAGPTGTFVDAAEQLVGTAGALQVTGRSAVWREANGDLSFYYQVFNHPVPVSTHEVKRLTTNGYAGWAIHDVGYSLAGFTGNGVTFVGGVPGNGTGGTQQQYDDVDRSSGVLNGGETIGWDFPQGLTPPANPSDPTIWPGQESVIMVLKTNAKEYRVTQWQYINGGVATGSGFAPASLVPEPASMLLAGAGLAPLAGLLKRRRRSSETEETEEVA